MIFRSPQQCNSVAGRVGVQHGRLQHELAALSQYARLFENGYYRRLGTLRGLLRRLADRLSWGGLRLRHLCRFFLGGRSIDLCLEGFQATAGFIQFALLCGELLLLFLQDSTLGGQRLGLGIQILPELLQIRLRYLWARWLGLRCFLRWSRSRCDQRTHKAYRSKMPGMPTNHPCFLLILIGRQSTGNLIGRFFY